MESPATMDMMACLKQICCIYAANEADVAKVSSFFTVEDKY